MKRNEIYRDMDGSRVSHTEWSQSEREKQMLYINTYVWNLQKWYEVKWSEVAQSCPALCNPVDCSLFRFSVRGIFQARVLEWVAISFSRGSSWPRDWAQVSHTVGRCFTLWATREVQKWYRWSYLQNRNRDRDMKRHMDTEEKGVVVGWPGGSALTYVHY